MIINKVINFSFNNYIIHVEYEATVNAHDDIEIEYNLLGGINEVEIIRNLYSDKCSYNEFQERVVELIDKIRLHCSMDAEMEYINRTVEAVEYNEER